MSGKDGAFPDRDGTLRHAKGLSKRELFAAMAMQGLCQNAHPFYEERPHNAAMANRAVALADELIAKLAETENKSEL